MRALLLTALFATAAAAQDAPQTVPLVDADRCDAPDAMPTPFEATPGAAALEVTFDGPAPVAMPNLCGEPAARADAGLQTPPAALVPYDGEGPLPKIPEAYRRWFDGPAPRVSPEALRRYRDLLDRAEPDAFERLEAPDAPRD